MPQYMPDQITSFHPKGRILAMDIGQKTIGLAVSDSAFGMALPLKTLFRKKFSEDVRRLAPVIREYDIGAYVLGWPLHMDGRRSAGCDRVQSFADEMMKTPTVFGENPDILFWDERLSTGAVGEMVGKSVDKMKERGELDALAAHIILQGALDALSTNP